MTLTGLGVERAARGKDRDVVPGVTVAGAGLTNALDECRGKICGLAIAHVVAEDLPAPHVLDEVQVEELTANEAAKVRDVPRRHLPRPVGDMLVRTCHRRTCTTTMML